MNILLALANARPEKSGSKNLTQYQELARAAQREGFKLLTDPAFGLS